MPHEEYCYAHHPDTKEERKEYGSKGGKRGGRGRQSPVTAELTRLQKKFEDLAAEVESGALDRGAAAVVCQLLNGARACVSTILKAKELEEIEQRIRELEQRYEERGASVRYGKF
jgi:alkylhydroperoxidase family enzyme